MLRVELLSLFWIQEKTTVQIEIKIRAENLFLFTDISIEVKLKLKPLKLINIFTLFKNSFYMNICSLTLLKIKL